MEQVEELSGHQPELVFRLCVHPGFCILHFDVPKWEVTSGKEKGREVEAERCRESSD